MKQRRERKRNNVVEQLWKGIEGESKEKRRGFMEEVMKRVLGRKVEARDV